MIAFTLRRLLQSAAVMAVVAFIAFGLFNFTGDPVAFMLGQDATAEERSRLRGELGLDQPSYVQFGRFAANAAQGEFGLSLRQGRSIAVLLKECLPATLELAIAAALLALAVGIPMGVYAALRRGSWLAHLFLTLSLFQMTLIMRLVRAEMLEVLRTDYIRFARARGLTDHAIHFGHALRNTLVPVITIIGLQLGAIIAFAIITETVFQWPGMGLLFIQAVNFADIPVMAAYLCFIALVFVVINLVVDLLYYLVDPRLRVERGLGH
jgi:peptide/nickel transport system permease protein